MLDGEKARHAERDGGQESKRLRVAEKGYGVVHKLDRWSVIYEGL
jgi:hypothetical protein